jgi:hypothetical protein
MRNEVLRDVLAGCAGVLAVAVAIGLPRTSTVAHEPSQFSAPRIVLLPHYSKLPNSCWVMPVAPSARPQAQHITICP